jgi:hypothetical protein
VIVEDDYEAQQKRVVDAQAGGITLVQAITNFGNERTTLHASLKAIEIVRLDTREAVDAAASVAAVDAVMAAIIWPA